MQENFHAEVAVSKTGQNWQKISSGSWQPGASVALRLDGEPIPEGIAHDVINDLIAVNPTGKQSGCSYAKAGQLIFRMTFHRSA
jgi:hypothetical protein